MRISLHMTDGIRHPLYKLASMHLSVSGEVRSRHSQRGEANSPFFRKRVDELHND